MVPFRRCQRVTYRRLTAQRLEIQVDGLSPNRRVKATAAEPVTMKSQAWSPARAQGVVWSGRFRKPYRNIFGKRLAALGE